MRILLSLALCLLANLASAVAATTTVDLRQGGTDIRNNVVQAAVNVTENVLVIQVSPGKPKSVMLVADTDWKYRTTTADSTTDLLVSSGQSLTLEFDATKTVYFLRSTADGTLRIVPVR